jgi:hypothetical protein
MIDKTITITKRLILWKLCAYFTIIFVTLFVIRFAYQEIKVNKDKYNIASFNNKEIKYRLDIINELLGRTKEERVDVAKKLATNLRASEAKTCFDEIKLKKNIEQLNKTLADSSNIIYKVKNVKKRSLQKIIGEKKIKESYFNFLNTNIKNSTKTAIAIANIVPGNSCLIYYKLSYSSVLTHEVIKILSENKSPMLYKSDLKIQFCEMNH